MWTDFVGEIQSSREELQVAGKEAHQRISTQAKFPGMHILRFESEIKESKRGRLAAEVGGGLSCDDAAGHNNLPEFWLFTKYLHISTFAQS